MAPAARDLAQPSRKCALRFCSGQGDCRGWLRQAKVTGENGTGDKKGVSVVHFGKDGKGQRYVEWEIALGTGILKRAWVQYRQGEKDWAETGRYLNVVRVEAAHSGPKGQAADFPIYLTPAQASDDQVLTGFVKAVSQAVGCQLPDGVDDAASHT